MIANAAVDAWSLGVLAVELFTNDVALDLMQGKDKVRTPIAMYLARMDCQLLRINHWV